ncbi:MAG TPA: hypothetical protein VF530_02050 [Planctomycetota bacterium]
MKRAWLGWGAGVAVLVVGILTAGLAAENRARGDELDRLQRWCEAQARRNELARLALQRREAALLAPREAEPVEARP